MIYTLIWCQTYITSFVRDDYLFFLSTWTFFSRRYNQVWILSTKPSNKL